LLGARQPGLDFVVSTLAAADVMGALEVRPPRPPRPHAASLEELAAHQAMLAAIKAPLWLSAA